MPDGLLSFELNTPLACKARLTAPTAYDYKRTLAAAGYDAPFFEPGSQLHELGSTACSMTSSFTRLTSDCLASRPLTCRSTASDQADTEERLDFNNILERSVDQPWASDMLVPPWSSPLSLKAPRPLSLAESFQSCLLSVDGARPPSPALSFMSALSAGEFSRKRERQANSRTSNNSCNAAQQTRRSMSPVLSSPASTRPICRISHWRSRTSSPPPPLAGPPPTAPLPPTPPVEPIALPSLKRRSNAVQRQRADARAALEGRPHL